LRDEEINELVTSAALNTFGRTPSGVKRDKWWREATLYHLMGVKRKMLFTEEAAISLWTSPPQS